MRSKNFPIEMVYQVFSLLVVFIIVHGTYAALIRPQADVVSGSGVRPHG